MLFGLQTGSAIPVVSTGTVQEGAERMLERLALKPVEGLKDEG